MKDVASKTFGMIAVIISAVSIGLIILSFFVRIKIIIVFYAFSRL